MSYAKTFIVPGMISLLVFTLGMVVVLADMLGNPYTITLILSSAILGIMAFTCGMTESNMNALSLLANRIQHPVAVPIIYGLASLVQGCIAAVILSIDGLLPIALFIALVGLNPIGRSVAMGNMIFGDRFRLAF